MSDLAASAPLVGIIMGSDSDLPVMQAAADALTELGVPFEMTIVSAHRTPKRLYDYAAGAVERGLKVIIAGAGGAAHLPGMAAAISPLPVIGVPVKSKALSGQDSLLSIVQMPPGVPVATVAIDGARNAGLLAAQILAVGDAALLERVAQLKRDLEAQVLGKVERMAAGEITAETVARARGGA
jgi:5-(carboxyamino)imidazole ribonucleotide mutase